MKKDKKTKNINGGLITFVICAILVLAIIIGCLCFPDELFGLFKK